MNLEEAKDFILFCKKNQVYQAQLGSLSFVIVPDSVESTIEKKQDDDSLLYYSSGS